MEFYQDNNSGVISADDEIAEAGRVTEAFLNSINVSSLNDLAVSKAGVIELKTHDGKPIMHQSILLGVEKEGMFYWGEAVSDLHAYMRKESQAFRLSLDFLGLAELRHYMINFNEEEVDRQRHEELLYPESTELKLKVKNDALLTPFSLEGFVSLLFRFSNASGLISLFNPEDERNYYYLITDRLH